MTHHRSDFTVEEGLKLYDNPARKLAKIVVPKVSNHIVIVKDNPNQYGVDLIGYDDKGNKIAYIEVECSHSWDKLEFPWKRLSYLEERKGRYLYEKRYQDLDMYFVMFNKNFKSFAITDRDSILRSPIQISERSWKGKESFRMISQEYFNWFIIKDLK